MVTLILGLVLFLGVHSTAIVALPWRNAMVAKLGLVGWKAVYGVLSLVGLALIVVGYAAARMEPVVLFVPPFWLRHVTLLLMVPFFTLLIAAYLPGRIKSTLKHPMLVAVKLWALSHLLANGMLADLLLFGTFLAWAVIDRISVKRRPVINPVATPPQGITNDLIAIVVGLGLYVVFLLWGHTHLIGVSPIGR
jgi:uncharacterized membrane protein